ncbi:Gfo/Idh/MocA family protein [Actinomadura macrotermitis]|uniref:Scyllo-inositol 2-dehydrogenase (NADP(+)) IolU n=1 Tax=Actinomadura macrotermitis TaxID=2585200 RepID=A0A7K0BU23_9ACTN|nr:Gfo/Idh/MocA family oxidoreductase [Actinomadura macrotermitis]MQY04669.1 scyllo-inositol 2-dehydrogenase (NADP(+)) IolU [Actinomadura macrotermitis]
MTDGRVPVRLGVIGCADIALRRTLPAMRADGGIEVRAIASRDVAKAERFAGAFGAGTALGDYAELLERDDVDAVYIPLPAALHAEWVERALLAGKHVLVEKPFTTERRETERLIALARERGRLLLENMMFLHHTQHARVDDLVSGGAIGEVRALAAGFTIPPKPRDDIRYRPDVGGGALVDIGVYPVAAALRFLGPHLRLVGAVLRAEREGGAVVGGGVLLSDPQGVTAQLTFGMEHSYHSGYELRGSSGRLGLERVFTPPPAYSPVVRIERQDHREEIVLPPADQFANVVGLFAAAVREGGDLTSWNEESLHRAGLLDDIRDKAEYTRVSRA